jgi:hypothetical protein
MDCTMVAAAIVLPAGYVVSASQIADRRMILAGYRLANLLTRSYAIKGPVRIIVQGATGETSRVLTARVFASHPEYILK